MKQAWESQQKITEQIAHLAKQSERRQKQMVHLLPLEVSLDLVQEGNAILHRHLQRQEEVMATQEWDLQDLAAKMVGKISSTAPFTFGQPHMLLNAESPGREVRGSECPMKEKLSKVKSEGRDSGFGHRGSESGRIG
ncbi:hypothetical protein BS17DRAFT_777019 [Gyrodon lividus]|nr:hypothetical protein BS17DRAFT_777019 [Gyrodon lividus]